MPDQEVYSLTDKGFAGVWSFLREMAGARALAQALLGEEVDKADGLEATAVAVYYAQFGEWPSDEQLDRALYGADGRYN